MRIKTIRTHGYTLIEILIVVLILGLILAMAIPNFARARKDAQRNVCIENLAQIESAKQIWGIEKGGIIGSPVTEADLIGPLLYIKTMPECPAGGSYDFGAIGTNAICDPFGATDGHKLDY